MKTDMNLRDTNFLSHIITEPCAIDSVFRWSDGFTYFFAGESYYRYNEISRGIDSGYPRAITKHWRGVPNNIDGVFRYVNGITYFFKGSEYYRFNDSTLQVDPGYPRKIKDFWKGIPDDIDDVIRQVENTASYKLLKYRIKKGRFGLGL
jgi:hypothetical protein